MPVLKKWPSLVRCLTAEVTEGLPQVEIQDVSTLIACCLEAAVVAEGKADDAQGALPDIVHRLHFFWGTMMHLT